MLRPSIDGKRKDSGSTAARYDLSYVDPREEQGKSKLAMIVRTK